MSTATSSRILESDIAGSLASRLTGVSVYRQGEDGTRVLPCLIVACRVTGIDYRVKVGGRYAEAAELTITALSDAAPERASDSVEKLAADAAALVETATLSTGWSYVTIERSGDERSNTDGGREIAQTWSCILARTV